MLKPSCSYGFGPNVLKLQLGSQWACMEKQACVPRCGQGLKILRQGDNKTSPISTIVILDIHESRLTAIAYVLHMSLLYV